MKQEIKQIKCYNLSLPKPQPKHLSVYVTFICIHIFLMSIAYSATRRKQVFYSIGIAKTKGGWTHKKALSFTDSLSFSAFY